MKKNLLFVFCIISIFFVCIMSVSADPVKVAINPDTKPFKYLDENGEFAGIDAEVINAIAEEKGLELEFVIMDFSKIIDAVSACEVDAAVSALTLTENRAEQVAFSEPYVYDMQSVFVRLKNDSFEDITNPGIRTIGAKAGTTSEASAKIIAEMQNIEYKSYSDYASLFEALENDVIDAAISDEILAKEFVDEYADMMTIGQPLASEPYAIAVCPANTELKETINDGLAVIQSNGRLDEIILKNLSGE